MLNHAAADSGIPGESANRRVGIIHHQIITMQFLQWLVTSSADPERYSLMFKSAAALVIPYILQAASLTCGLHLICISVDQTVLMSAVDTCAKGDLAPPLEFTPPVFVRQELQS
jgi:hypothetical protein